MVAVIQSFADKTTERVWLREITTRIGTDIQRLAHRNRLEALKGARRGQYSIRVNDQFRICFRWTPTGPTDVEVTDYH